MKKWTTLLLYLLIVSANAMTINNNSADDNNRYDVFRSTLREKIMNYNGKNTNPNCQININGEEKNKITFELDNNNQTIIFSPHIGELPIEVRLVVDAKLTLRNTTLRNKRVDSGKGDALFINPATTDCGDISKHFNVNFNEVIEPFQITVARPKKVRHKMLNASKPSQ